MRLYVALAALLAAVTAHGTAHAEAPDGIRARTDGAGTIYTDAQDRTLYTYAQDKDGKSACVGACAKAWPPLAAPETATAKDEWSVIAREGGARQWAWKGMPLYTFAKDNTGTTFGDGLANFAWRTAFAPIFTPPGVTVRQAVPGRILADLRGTTLYWRNSGACTGKCLETWTPLPAPLAAVAKGDWTPQPREDGTRQWAYKGRALYTFTGDIKAGDVRGKGDGWAIAILAPAIPPPSWVTVQSSDFGEIFADRDGRTLYTGPPDLSHIRELLCDQACLDRVWKTVKAEADATSAGDWSVVSDEGGAKAWAYRGNVLWVHLRDTKPGDVGGDKWAAGVGNQGPGWSVIVRSRGTDDAP